MKKNQKILNVFFRCLGIGFIISCIKTRYEDMQPLEILSTLFLTFLFNFIVGIWAAITSLFWFIGIDLYTFIKKKETNEKYWNLHRFI